MFLFWVGNINILVDISTQPHPHPVNMTEVEVGLVFPRPERDKESSFTFKICSLVSKENGLHRTPAHTWHTLQPTPESAVCGPSRHDGSKEGETRREGEQGMDRGHGGLALRQALGDFPRHLARKPHADAHTGAQPWRKVLAQCGFIPLRSKKSQMNKVFLSSAKGKQPNNKTPKYQIPSGTEG